MLNDLHIPHITLLDLDKEREGGGWGRIKYVIEQLIQNGYDKDELLKIEGGVLSDEKFNKMQEWNVEDFDSLQHWVEALEKYNIFFSAPLDIDFMMLEHYGMEKKYNEMFKSPEEFFRTSEGIKVVKMEPKERKGPAEKSTGMER